MPRGGHARSGPPADEKSGRSERRKFRYSALPIEGYDGEAPEFPLPLATAREIEVWVEAWRTPQACAWIEQPWRWRTVALWARWSVRVEAPDASAALGTVALRFADDIGLSTGGMKLNGWKIADAGPTPVPRQVEVTSIRDRLAPQLKTQMD